MDVVQKVMKNSAVLMAEKMALSVLSIFVVSYVARNLGEVDYGKFALAFAFVMLFKILGNMGLWTLTVREVAKDKSIAGSFLGHSLLIHGFLIALTFSSIMIAVRLLGYSSDTRILIYVAGLALAGELVTDCFRAIFQAFQRMEYSALLRILYGLFVGGFAVGALYLGYGVLTVSLGYFIGNIFAVIVAYFLVVRYFVKPEFQIDLHVWKKMLRRSLPFALHAFFILIAFKIDIVMLSKIKGEAAVGWYNIAANLTYRTLFIAVAFCGSVYPAICELLSVSSEKVSKLVTRSFYFLIALGLPLAIGGTLLGPQIISFLFGERYVPSILVFQVIVWFIPLCYVCSLFGNVLVAMDLQKIVVRTGGLKAVTNVGLNAFLIPTLGPLGAAIATVITEGFVAVYYFYVVSRRFAFGSLYHKFRALAICNAGLVGLLFLPQVSRLHFSLQILLGMITYFALMVASGGFNRQDMVAVRSFLPRRAGDGQRTSFWS